MLNNLVIKNFKSWGEANISFQPFTGFFGPNSSGKTSLLQFILLLKQTAESSDRGQALDLGGSRSFVELGTFQDMVTKHDLTLPFKFEVAWNTAKKIEVRDPLKKKESKISSDALRFSTEIKSDAKGRISVQRMSYHLGETEFFMSSKNGNGSFDLKSEPEKTFSFVRTLGRKWPLPSPYKCYGFPDEVKTYFQNAGFLADLSLEFEKLFANVFYLGPLRDYPRRQYTWGGSNPSDVGRRGELSMEAILASRDRNEKISRGRFNKSLNLEEYVALWLKDLGLIEEFRVEPVAEGSKVYEVKVRKSVESPLVSITDVGFGVSQILPVITLCYFAPPGSVLLIEQPEIHLHPSVQSGLADVFLDAIEKRQVQIVLESHSEHLLQRLQRRIAEGKMPAEKASLYFCQTQNGLSHLQSLQLNLFGQIQNWPENFFGDEMAELYATSQAIQNRKQQTNGNDDKCG